MYYECALFHSNRIHSKQQTTKSLSEHLLTLDSFYIMHSAICFIGLKVLYIMSTISEACFVIFVCFINSYVAICQQQQRPFQAIFNKINLAVRESVYLIMTFVTALIVDRVIPIRNHGNS